MRGFAEVSCFAGCCCCCVAAAAHRLLPEEPSRQVVRLDSLPHIHERLELYLRLSRQRLRIKTRVKATAVRRLHDRTACRLRESRLLRRLLPTRRGEPPCRAWRLRAGQRARRHLIRPSVSLQEVAELARALHLHHRILRLVHSDRDLDAGAAFDTGAAAGRADAEHLDLTATVRVELAHVDLGWWERRVA